MKEIETKPITNDYGSFDTYRILREGATQINMLQIQVAKQQQEIDYIKQILLKITNGTQ